MRLRIAGYLLSVACLAVGVGAEAQKKKGQDFTVLKRPDLEKLAGVWEMKVDTKKGWKGTVRATITLFPAGSKEENFALILYDYDLVRDKDKSSIRNAPLGGIAFAVMRRGQMLLLVTAERKGIGPTVPFKVVLKEELSAPITVTKDKLEIDVSKSAKHFCFPMMDFDLPWNQLRFIKNQKN
jgi:hypothetical protein